jgi:ABC-type sugar transport system substrate-binding protein
MAHDHDDHAAGLSRRRALEGLMWGAGILTVAGGLPAPWRPVGRARAAAAQTPTIPVIVRDTTKPYWQSVLAGARKAPNRKRTSTARSRFSGTPLRRSRRRW